MPVSTILHILIEWYIQLPLLVGLSQPYYCLVRTWGYVAEKMGGEVCYN
jgi:hypothetical protein